MRVWNVATGRVFAAPAGHSSWIYAIAYSPNGRLLASASTDSSIRLWDPQSGMAIGTLRGHDSGIVSMAFSPIDTLLVSASSDKVKLWNVSADSLQSLDQDANTLPSNDGSVEAPSLGKWTLSDTVTGHVIGHIGASWGADVLVGLSRSSQKLYTVRYDPKRGVSVVAWDMTSSQVTARIPFGSCDYAPEFCGLNPDGTLLAVSGWVDGPVQLFTAT